MVTSDALSTDSNAALIAAIKDLKATLDNIDIELNPAKTNSVELMDFGQTMKYLNIKGSKLRRLVFDKSIPVLRIGRTLRFKKESINRWLETL